MEMVYCRGCAKEIHHTAGACPQCGASQAGPAATAVQRNPFKLIALAVLYTVGFWIASMFLAGVVGGAFDAANAEARGEQVGQLLSGPFLLASIGLAVALTVYGKLPGTVKPVGAGLS
jgi:hypothetical protein